MGLICEEKVKTPISSIIQATDTLQKCFQRDYSAFVVLFLTFHHMEEVLDSSLVQTQRLRIVLSFILLGCLAGKVDCFLK